MSVRITVKGMGLLVNNEVNLLEKLLTEAGYIVEVKNEYPDPEDSKLISPPGLSNKIVLIAEHEPWPG